jgi:hypothetical protein
MVEELRKLAMRVEVRVPAGKARLPLIDITAPSSGTGPDNWIVSTPETVPGSMNTIAVFCEPIVVGWPVRPDVTVPVKEMGE